MDTGLTTWAKCVSVGSMKRGWEHVTAFEDGKGEQAKSGGSPYGQIVSSSSNKILTQGINQSARTVEVALVLLCMLFRQR